MWKLFFLLAVILLVEVHGSYDASQALSTLFLSYAAYCDTSQLAPWNCNWCNKFTSSNGAPFIVTDFIFNDDLNIFTYIGYFENTAYVIFRGTQPTSATNWAEDIDAFQISYPLGPGYVHEGFYGDWLALKNAVQVAITNLAQKSYINKVCFTGHSLGAAMTMLAALEVGPTLGKSFYVYTFGEPRVGDPDFANYWTSRIPPGNSYRVVNDADIVPHLPLESMGFQHPPTEVWYTTPSSYKVCDTSGEDDSCSDSLWDPDSIIDHLNYLGQDLDDGC